MQRTPYRPKQDAALSRIEERRVKLGISFQELALAADIPLSTLRRLRKCGRASDAQITALRFAIRTIERRRRETKTMFGGEA
ncbi:hypothetical protein [Agrobacterium larrymoorei]|uniref:Transcriptional regulator n=1 Tax=Agrobacterium larrymoorei TaxID=160699 RepID=A0ABU0ULW2_9HYPH|nr:hypothetical protein [Agrobacterium larrymoorei]MDQ1185953.1 putative transcriptional regulator [Agrobacterium larrymoorei]